MDVRRTNYGFIQSSSSTHLPKNTSIAIYIGGKWNFESPVQIEHNGASLFVTTLGTGPDVILLHPTPVHHAFWLPVAELLADRYRLTLLDLRGHGKSSLGAGEAAIAMGMLADDTHAVLQALQIEHAAFVGCSIGSYTLYEYWRRFPQEMAALVITCGKPQPDTEANREKRRESMHAAQQPGGLQKFFDQTADTLVGPTAKRLHPDIRAAARAMIDGVSLEAMLAVQQGLMQRPDSVPTLKTIHVPICALAGGEDQGSTTAEMHIIAEQAPRAEFHLLQDAGHYAPLEQPQNVATLIADFLDREYRPRHSVRAARKAH
ncbi:MAG: alpha/beta fold hydrolase [Acidobacteriaceae bacterium]